ncbi:MAG: TDT family transporter [Clostridia bacterium]|nr:TDT family transporter [Clostridia bacterium]
MIGFLKKLPLPISGLMLALASLGNLLGSYSHEVRWFCGILSGTILFFLILKIIRFPDALKENFQSPVTAGVMQTIPMTIILLAAYLKPDFPNISFVMWVIGLLISGGLVILFTKKHVMNFSLSKVFPTYFVLYVGIVTGSVTAPAFGQIIIGQILFWFGLLVYLPLIPVVLYRVVKYKNIPEPAANTIIIFAAPASLLLAGYLSAFSEKNMVMVTILMSVALFMTGFAVLQMPRLLKFKFYPSISSYTFPFVISALALKMANAFLIQSGFEIKALSGLVIIQIIWATLMVLYILIRYLRFMTQ